MKFTSSRVGAQGLELLSKRNREMREIKDRNTEEHQEGNSVTTEPPVVIIHTLVYFTPKGEGGATDLMNII